MRFESDGVSLDPITIRQHLGLSRISFAPTRQRIKISGLALWSTHMAGCFSVGYVKANNLIVEFFEKAADAGLLPERKIPQEVAFDFMTTALMLSDGEAEEQMRTLGPDKKESTEQGGGHVR
jgi:hypothetical protein